MKHELAEYHDSHIDDSEEWDEDSAVTVTPWKPDWRVAPGEILQEWLEEHDQELELPTVSKSVDKCLRKEPLSSKDIVAISELTGISLGFWTKAESLYRRKVESE